MMLRIKDLYFLTQIHRVVINVGYEPNMGRSLNGTHKLVKVIVVGPINEILALSHLDRLQLSDVVVKAGQAHLILQKQKHVFVLERHTGWILIHLGKEFGSIGDLAHRILNE